MRPLSLPAYPARIREAGAKKQIFDPVRKKFIALTPEEWVRQHFLNFLIHEKKYPSGLISLEKGLKYNSLAKRTDILIHDLKGSPVMLIECKAFSVKISQKVFDQAATYNLSLGVKYLILTNGITHFCCSLDHEKKQYHFHEGIPEWNEIADLT